MPSVPGPLFTAQTWALPDGCRDVGVAVGGGVPGWSGQPREPRDVRIFHPLATVYLAGVPPSRDPGGGAMRARARKNV